MLETGGEGGSVPVLEAIIVSTLLVSAIAFVVTWDTPPAADEAARTNLAQKAQDAMFILRETPVQGNVGDTMLASYVSSCLQGDCSPLQKKLDRLLPSGASYALYMSNGRQLFPVYEPASPDGPSVTARVTMEPKWSSTFLETAVPRVNPSGDPIVLTALPIYNSNALTSDGTPVIVTLEGRRVSDLAQYTMQAAVSTSASMTAGKTASMAFMDEYGNALANLDGTGTTITIAKTPSGVPLPLRLRVSETGGGTIPANAVVTVAMPPGWTANATYAANSAQWTLVSNATDARGSDVVAKLKNPLSSQYVELHLEATYVGGANDYYPIHADLSQGAAAHAVLVVRADAKLNSATYEVPTLLVGAPRPLGVGAPTTWTVSAHMPAAVPGFPAEAIAITRVTLRADDGSDVLTTPITLTGPAGAWSKQGTTLVWTGAMTMAHDLPFSLVFNATGIAATKPVSDRAAYTPEAALGATIARLPDETSPGMHRVAIPPGSRGYDSSIGPWLEKNHSVTAIEPYRQTELPGSTNYSVGYFRPLQDALFGCVAQVGQRNVQAGGTQSLYVNVQPVMYTLAALGASPSVTLNVYPPWAGDNRTPFMTRTLAPATTLDPDNLDPAAGTFNVSLGIAPETLYGAYVVEVEVAWNEQVTKDLGSGPVTVMFDRTARVYDYYLVTPPTLLTPPTPLYEVHLVAWMGDWR